MVSNEANTHWLDGVCTGVRATLKAITHDDLLDFGRVADDSPEIEAFTARVMERIKDLRPERFLP